MAHFYRRQPPRGTKVAGGAPLGRGITAHFPFNGSLASVARTRGRSPVVTSGPALRNGAAGWYVQGNGAGKIVYPDLLPSTLGVNGAAPRTFIADFYMGDTSTQRCVLSLGDSSNTSRSQFTLHTNDQYQCVALHTYGNDFRANVLDRGGTGARVLLAVTYDGNVTITFKSLATYDIDGTAYAKTQSFTLQAPLNTGNTVPLNIMGGGTYGFASMTTALYHLSIYGGRCLSPAEIDRIFADRHQVMEAPKPFPYAGLAAAAAAPDVELAGAALSAASALGTLATTLRLDGKGAALATATASLTTALRLAGSATVQASATGTLVGEGAALAGVARVAAIGSAALATSIALSGTGAGRASAVGTLTARIALSGTALARTSAAAELLVVSGAIDISKVSPGRIAVFGGSGSRIAVFDSSGSRVAVFNGSGSRVSRF